MNSAIVSYRSAVDELDNQMAALLKRRFELARELAVAKKNAAVPVMDHERELSILERVSTLSSDSPDRTSVVAVFRHIIQESRAVQLRTDVGKPSHSASSQGAR
jgi:chorismate mutase